jgi:hypothetical protein
MELGQKSKQKANRTWWHSSTLTEMARYLWRGQKQPQMKQQKLSLALDPL